MNTTTCLAFLCAKINQRIMDYCTLEFVVEDKPLADKLIAHCAAFKIANRKFEIEFKRAAKFFYSVFFFIYVNPTLIDHLPNSPFLKDIFNDLFRSSKKSKYLLVLNFIMQNKVHCKLSPILYDYPIPT